MRNSTGGCPAANVAAAGISSMIFHPFTGNALSGASGFDSVRVLPDFRMACSSSVLKARGSNSLCAAIWIAPSAVSSASCSPGARSITKVPTAKDMAVIGSETCCSFMVEERRISTLPPARKARSVLPSPKSPKFRLETAPLSGNAATGSSPSLLPLNTASSGPDVPLIPTTI